MKRFSQLAIRQVYLQPGELFIDSSPALVQTILGSCISVTMFCRRGSFGGICHALLPSGRNEEPGRHVEGAVTLLLDRMLCLGARHDLLEVKLFGGGRVLAESRSQRPAVGEQNLIRARALLQELRLPVIADDTGGQQGRRLFFNSGTGEVFVRKMRNSTLVASEIQRSIAA